jgi:hypothetical protein
VKIPAFPPRVRRAGYCVGEAAYRRGELLEKRRRLMAAWADYCNKAPAAGTVVELRSVVL